ncbi:unnamed protein product, partial [Durusdinium trenchii]
MLMAWSTTALLMHIQPAVMMVIGVGWGIEELMHKSTKLNMPMALGVAASWSAYTEFPFLHPKSHFYWWIPDPTFLELEPVQVVYPPHDKRLFSSGDLSTATVGVSVDKHVSRDLSILAPNVENFVSKILMTLEDMNACPSGTFSQLLEDSIGETYICVP